MTVKISPENVNEAGEKTWEEMDLQMKVHMLKSVEAMPERHSIRFSFIVTAAYAYHHRFVKQSSMRRKKRSTQKARRETQTTIPYKKNISEAALGREYIDDIYAQWEAKVKTPDELKRQVFLDDIIASKQKPKPAAA